MVVLALEAWMPGALLWVHLTDQGTRDLPKPGKTPVKELLGLLKRGGQGKAGCKPA